MRGYSFYIKHKRIINAAPLFVIILSVFPILVFSQTNPTTQNIPFVEDFTGTAHTSTTYPAGIQGWQISTTPGSSFNTVSPTGDRTLIASSTAATTSGNVHNYDGKIGFLNTGSLDLSLCFAISTINFNNISVSYDIATIRNPHDGGTNTRINEVTLQYRIGTTGNFTNLTGIEYQNNTTTQTSGTTPQNTSSKTITLPAGCDNQSVVQLKWISREVSGAGSRPSFSFDNISVDGLAKVTNLTIINASATSANISWTAPVNYNAGTMSTLVFIKATSAITQGTPSSSPGTYTANTAFGSGTAYQNDANAYCVYNGDGTSVTVTGLTAGTEYHVLVYNVLDATPSYSLATVANTRSMWEDCEAGSKTGYACGNPSFTSGTWDLCDVLRGTDANDRKNGSAAMRAQTSGTATMNFDLPNGAQTFSVYHAKFGTDNNTTWVLEKSVDAATSWIQVGNEITTNSTTLTLQTFTVNEPCPVRFRLRKTDGVASNRTNWDDISVTNYTGNCIKDYYYRSAGTGNWNTLGAWEESTDLVSWVAATNLPSAEGKTITIRSPHIITITNAITFDQLTVDNGAILIWDETAGDLRINDGPGVDLIVNGEFEVDPPATKIILWLSSSSWLLGTSGTLKMSGPGSTANLRDRYSGGIANIPSTANWILNKEDTRNPSVASVGGMYYPNLIIINTSGGSWTSTTGSNFQGSSDFPRIKGNFDIGGTTSTNPITFTNENSNATPVLIQGDLLIRTTHTLRLDDAGGADKGGTGFEIQGNVTIDGTLDYQISDADNTNRIIKFSGSNAQTVSGAGTGNIFNMVIDKTTNNVTLNRPLTINNQLTLTNGKFITTSANIINIADNATSSTGSNTSYVEGPIKKTGNDAFTFPTGKGGKWAGIGISAPSSTTDEFTAEYFYNDYGSNAVSCGLNNASQAEYWNLDRTNGTSDVRVTLHWNDASQSFITDCADLTVAHRTGSTWCEETATADGGSSCSGSGSGSVTTDANVTSFSPFTFGSKSPAVNPLPVELIYFSGTLIEEQVLLNWITSSEVNSDYFEILRSNNNGIEFISVGKIKASGFSNSEIKYQFSDIPPTTDNPHFYYKLKQVDYDGHYMLTHSISVKINSNSDVTFFPNPVAINENLTIVSNTDLLKKIEIYDITGRVILSKEFTKQLVISIPVSGVYSILINGNSTQTRKTLIVK